MQSDLISVMMPVFNGEKYLRQAIDSLLAQTYPHWELIVVDDGSTDRSAEILAGYSDPRIRVIHQRNMGEAGARNTALDQIRGAYLAFLDADDQYLPTHLQSTLGYLSVHPEMDGVYTDGYYINQDDVRLKPLSARRRGPFQGDIFAEVIRSSDVFGAPLCVVLRSEVIPKHGLRFDSEIVIGPDWDFLAQYAMVAAFGYLGEQTCLYRVHQTNISLRTGIEKRIRSLTRCREKAIQMRRFAECGAEIRSFIFYDLLIMLLRGNFTRQDEIVTWPEFSDLPVVEQARLLRMMASRAVLLREGEGLGGKWIHQARDLHPRSLATLLLSLAYNLHPGVCRLLIRAKNRLRPENEVTTPFADLMDQS